MVVVVVVVVVVAVAVVVVVVVVVGSSSSSSSSSSGSSSSSSSRSESCRSSSRVVEVGEGGPAGFGSEGGRGQASSSSNSSSSSSSSNSSRRTSSSSSSSSSRERKCVKCAYRRRNSPPAASTPLRAGSASSMKNKMRAGSLARVFWGLKRREKGRFHLRLIQHASRSADPTPNPKPCLNLPKPTFCSVPINSILGFIIRAYKKVGFGSLR